MMDVTVKTLDSQTRQFSVPEQITVKEFKERIAGSVNIPATTQRLIFCGRVLQDAKKLSEYDVHGRTIHLVEKPPPSTNTSGSSTSSSTTSAGGSGSEGRDSFLMGAITVQADVGDAGNVHVQPNGSHMDVHINLGPINVAPPVSASQQRVNQIQNLLRQVNALLDRLENPTQIHTAQTDRAASTPSRSTPANSSASANSSPPTTTSSNTQTNQQSSTTTGDAAPASEAATDGQARDNQGRRSSTVTHPRGTVMADILTEMARVSNRLQPFLDQYRELLSGDQVFEGDSDRLPAHRLQTQVNQALHYISHIYHAISDCMMDLNTSPPRVLRAPAGMMVAPIRPPGQMPVHVNIGQPAQPAQASTQAQDQPASQASQATTSASDQPATTTAGSRAASTRTSATSTTQTHSREQQQVPVLTNASVTLTNQQTFVITPRAGAPGYVAMPVSSSSGPTPPAAGAPPATSGAQAESGGTGNRNNQPGPTTRSQGPHVHIHQLGLNPGSIPPAGLLQVMAQMVGQQQMQQMAQFPANHAGPTNTSSTPTTSSPRAQQNSQSTPSPQNQNQSQSRQSAQTPPSPLAFFNPLQSRQAWDPLLPCNSRHITVRHITNIVNVGSTGRGRAGAGSQNAATGTAGSEEAAGRNPGDETRAESAQNDGVPQPLGADGSLSDMIGGLVGALLNQQQQPFVQVVPGAQQTTQQAQATRQQPRQAGGSSGSSSSAPTGGSEPGGRSGEPLTDHMLINMVMRMSQEMGDVGTRPRSNQSMRQFLAGMGVGVEPGEGFMGEVLDLVTQQLGIADFAAMFLGQPAPLDRLRPSLERFVNERVMRGQPMNSDNIQVAVGRIMDEVQPSVAEFMSGAQTVQNIDAVATHMKFLHSILERFVRLFAPPSEPRAFGEQMRSLGQNALHQWVALMLYIFGDRPSVDRFLSERLRTWFSGPDDSGPGSLVASMSLQNFDLAHRMLTITPDQVAHFIVKKQPASDTDRSASETSSTPAATGSSMETEQQPDQLEDSLDNDQVIIEAQILVEEEWVPVINQDIGRQRRQAPQGGLSDAYLAGMPPKRMKLTQDRKAPINNGVETFIPNTLRRAVQAVGAQPLTSVQALVQDAEASSSLHEACEEQIRSALQERLRRDPDYDPQRFPHTDKYIHKKK
ncbi:large proline-rich protein BAG6-like isoform X2 [Patiria miniata]|uniref:BCL2-associated athanogene 6 n=1 Tax=Patiria miniata TaxID=46514 RepID=A0A913Z0L5_PATMI|nr:large proline-rich protein BAG6-like isoform X2 [Patiria miniata]